MIRSRIVLLTSAFLCLCWVTPGLAVVPSEGGRISGAPGERVTADRPDEVEGAQIHVVYAIPSDGADRSLDLDGTLAASVSVFQAWLTGQTGGRGLRLDTHDGRLDVTFFELSRTDASLRSEGAFVRDRIEDELDAAGFDDPDKLYAVYYDGSSTWACGGGAWPPTLPGNVGALYLKGTPAGAPPCSSNAFAPAGSTPGYLEYAMLHEIVHTLGFVAECAPNHHRAGHVTSPHNDFMYAGNEPWDLSNVVLDQGHDDYYDHGIPGCPDLADSRYLTSADQSVEASIASVRAVKVAGKRIVKVVLRARENADTLVKLMRGSKTLSSRSVSSVEPGTTTVSLAVPRSARPGPALVVAELTDEAGNEAVLRRSVRIPSR